MSIATADLAALHRLVHVDRGELIERVTRHAEGGREVELFVHDMRCAACAGRIRTALVAVAGVHDARVDPTRRTALVRYDQSRTTLAEIVGTVESAGYTPTFAGVAADDPALRAARRTELKRLGVAGIAMMQVMMFAVGSYAGALQGITPFWESLLRWSGFVFALPVVLYSAQPFFVNAARSIRHWLGRAQRRDGLAMDVPVALAIALAFVASVHATLTGRGDVYFDSITMFTFFLLTARYLEQRVRHRLARFDHWLGMLPESALLLGANGPVPVPIEQLRTDDEVLVPQGTRIPADGVVIAGASHVDEATLTGESIPVERRSGDVVYAGTINVAQPLTIRLANRRSGTRIAAIERLATRASLERPEVVTLSDRLAQRFVVALLVLAAATAVVWLWVDPSRALSAVIAVLVVSCPCALSLATPTAITAATMALRRRGFVVTRAHVIERLARADMVVFDKTGTLSTGNVVLESTCALGSDSTPRCIAIATALEHHANHPLQRAFAGAALSMGVPVPTAHDVEVTAGAGIEGVVDGQRYRLGTPEFCGAIPHATDEAPRVVLASDGTALATFAFRDELRADATATISALERLGIEVEALSGDAEARCAATAEALDIDVRARVSPEAKLERVRALTARGRHVVMVGDGVNDVPGLAAATVSIAPADATDLACSSSDAMLLSRGIAPLALAIVTARRTYRVIRQNLTWAFGYNLVCIPLAAAGVLPAWLAALGMSLSSLAVTTNALRLVRDRDPWKS